MATRKARRGRPRGRCRRSPSKHIPCHAILTVSKATKPSPYVCPCDLTPVRRDERPFACTHLPLRLHRSPRALSGCQSRASFLCCFLATCTSTPSANQDALGGSPAHDLYASPTGPRAAGSPSTYVASQTNLSVVGPLQPLGIRPPAAAGAAGQSRQRRRRRRPAREQPL